ncbi:hypothetical protein L6452_01361 [Arctium lappa]|uniref:Uncharacterized protein n=1 Tax=Arctium lappa TaxID=4217 RepID=A0ACB9FGG8_ARCLA|nr:hypothetical protein L6452_01361 [Arctium lappa]
MECRQKSRRELARLSRCEDSSKQEYCGKIWQYPRYGFGDLRSETAIGVGNRVREVDDGRQPVLVPDVEVLRDFW